MVDTSTSQARNLPGSELTISIWGERNLSWGHNYEKTIGRSVTDMELIHPGVELPCHLVLPGLLHDESRVLYQFKHSHFLRSTHQITDVRSPD